MRFRNSERKSKNKLEGLAEEREWRDDRKKKNLVEKRGEEEK